MVNKNKKLKSRLNFTLKVTKNEKVLDKYETCSKRNFLNHVRTINWKDKPLKVYLRVYYGKHLDVWGKYTPFYNDGVYENKKDFSLALKAFLEKD